MISRLWLWAYLAYDGIDYLWERFFTRKSENEVPFPQENTKRGM